MTLIFAAACSLKTVHGLLLHHSHAARPLCEAKYDGKGAHIHDERYAANDCSLCAFVLSVPEMLSISALFAPPAKLPDSESPVLYQQPAVKKTACDSTLRRGPPVA